VRFTSRSASSTGERSHSKLPTTVGGGLRTLEDIDAMLRSGKHAYAGRKIRKRDMRSMWIVRITAALTGKEVNYSTLLNGLKKANIQINRKMLSDLAIRNPGAFDKVVEAARAALQR